MALRRAIDAEQLTTCVPSVRRVASCPRGNAARCRRFLGVDDASRAGRRHVNFAGVADLAAHLGVKRRDVEDDGGLVFHGDDFEDVGRRLQLVVADKLGGRGGLDLGEVDDFLFWAARARACCSSISFSKPATQP